MNTKRKYALLPLAAAVAVLLAPRLLPQARQLSQDAEKARACMKDALSRCSARQRSELAAFYASAARATEKLPGLGYQVTNAQYRQMLETAVKLRFSGEFQAVPGLAAAIHGSDGAIARIYGLDAGPLDAPRMASALRAVSEACTPENSLLQTILDMVR